MNFPPFGIIPAAGGTPSTPGQAAFSPTVIYKTADQTVASGTLTNDTQLAAPLVAGAKYDFDFMLHVTPADAGTGVQTSIAATNGLTALNYIAQTFHLNITGSSSPSRQSALNAAGVGLALSTTQWCRIVGTIEVTAAGTLQLQHACASGANGETVLRGSRLTLTRIS